MKMRTAGVSWEVFQTGSGVMDFRFCVLHLASARPPMGKD